MSFKLLKLTTLYPEFLDVFFRKNLRIKQESFQEQMNQVLRETSEPAGTYSFILNKMGVDSKVIIINSKVLQKAWMNENSVRACRHMKDLVTEQVRQIKPEVLWLDDTSLINDTWIRNIRNSVPSVRLIFGTHCAPFNKYILEDFKWLDFIVTCTPGLRDEFRNNGIRSYLVYHGFNEDILSRVPVTTFPRTHNFVFTGSLYQGGLFHNNRLEYIEQLLKHFDIELYCNLESLPKTITKKIIQVGYKIIERISLEKQIDAIPSVRRHYEYLHTPIKFYSSKLRHANKSPVFGNDMFRLLSNSGIVFNIHGEISGDYAGNVRMFEATGMACCLITDYKSNLKELFDPDNEIVTYSSVEECLEKIQWLMNNPVRCESIARAGQLRTLSDHSAKSRCENIVEIISSELRKPGNHNSFISL